MRTGRLGPAPWWWWWCDCRSLVAASILALLIASVSCGPESTAAPARLMEAEPTRQLVPGLFTELETVFTWTFLSPEDVDSWTAWNVDREFSVRQEALVVESSSSDPFFFRPVEIDASSVDVVRVSMTSASDTPAKLYWARSGESFAEERSLRARMVGEPEPAALFEVAAHPEWSDRIVRLRLDPTSSPDQRIRIDRIEALKGRVVPERLEEVVEVAWKVDLDAETRNGRLTIPGDALRMRARIPGTGGELRFGTGIWREVIAAATPDMEMRFRVIAGHDGEDLEQIFETRVELAGERGSSWLDHAVDVSGYAGETVELVFEAAAEGFADPRLGLAAWTGLEVVPSETSHDRAPSVILISVDTLRADHLSLYGYERRTSPNIDGWATSSAVTFETAVVQGAWTLSSHASILTGIDALRHGANYPNLPLSPGLTTLAEVLREVGYRTVAITGGGYMDPQYGFAQGFDRYKHALRRGTEDARRELEDGIDLAIREMEAKSPRPLFLFLHTYEVHTPYFMRQPHFDRWAAEIGGSAPAEDLFINSQLVPAEASTGFVTSARLRWRSLQRPIFQEIAEAELPVINAMYDSGIAHMDAQLGRLFGKLDELGLREDTLVILTSDHGELFGEHGLFGHGSLYDANLLVPLVFAMPGRLPGGRRIEHQVRSVDIFPTVLELVGVIPPPNDGVSLVPMMTGAPDAGAPTEAWSYAPTFGVSVRTTDHLKYIYNHAAWPGRRGPEELYRIDRDPGETNNVLVSASNRALASLRRRVHDRLKEAPGLMVSVVNGEGTPFSGMLEGPVRVDAVTATRMPCACVDFLGGRNLGFELPPGQSVTLRLENLVGTELVATGWFGERTDSGAPTFRVDLGARQAPRRWTFAFRGSGWQEVEPDFGELRTGIRIWWTGEPRGASHDPAELDPELLRQLEALGYVR